LSSGVSDPSMSASVTATASARSSDITFGEPIR
jgi:hypothetical protein